MTYFFSNYNLNSLAVDSLFISDLFVYILYFISLENKTIVQ